MEERVVQGGYAQQKIMMTNRSQGTITGVKDVLSFDANEILLDTELGMLMIKGKNLHVIKLMVEKGEVALEGVVDSMTYSDVKKQEERTESFLAKLFK